jgi:hypothetical protein
MDGCPTSVANPSATPVSFGLRSIRADAWSSPNPARAPSVATYIVHENGTLTTIGAIGYAGGSTASDRHAILVHPVCVVVRRYGVSSPATSSDSAIFDHLGEPCRFVLNVPLAAQDGVDEAVPPAAFEIVLFAKVRFAAHADFLQHVR